MSLPRSVMRHNYLISEVKFNKKLTSFLNGVSLRYFSSFIEGKEYYNVNRSNFYAKYSTRCGEQRLNLNSKETSGETAKLKKEELGDPPHTYIPPYVEAKWYEWWEKSGFHKPECQISRSSESIKAKPFVVCLPPPNITGTLHLGHALTNAIQDAIVRWKKERIFDQMKKLGSSLDWSRSCFTMDKMLSCAVVEAFVRLHDEGLIYRSNQLINWSCQLKSAISDIEVESLSLEGKTKLSVPGYREKVVFGTLVSFAYPVVETDEEIVISTTRPETMLGDVAVAVHPADTHYQHLHGKYVKHPFLDRKLPIITDKFVDMKFGTGAVKITPAHDLVDYSVGVRHSLNPVTVISGEGRMINAGQLFEGMKRFDARVAVIQELKNRGLYRGSKDHAMTIPICSRSKDVIEYLLKEQWFLDCKDMAQQAVKVVKEGKLKFVPKHHENIWYEWLENTRDWCISRQLWWGHRIPAFHATILGQEETTGVWVSGRNRDEVLLKASQKLGVSSEQIALKQDEDVLDTWFSSALFPFSALGWPEQTKDFKSFYPTSFLETGNDIIFFWVARMVMLGIKLTGIIPFQEVLLHGLLRDAHGRKMSKSLGNVIDPMAVIQGITQEALFKQLNNSFLDSKEIKIAKEGLQRDFPNGIPQCGADALRFTLCSYDFKGQFINMNLTHVKANRHFCNKVWQAFKFVTLNLGENFTPSETFQLSGQESAVDLWILSRLSHMVKMSDTCFRSYSLHHVALGIQKFWHNEFCDFYVECVKPVLKNDSEAKKEIIRQILYTCVETSLRALSPFMPYITEELYQSLVKRGVNWAETICLAPYPCPEQFPWKNEKIDKEMAIVQSICNKALFLKKEFNLSKIKVHVFLQDSDEGLQRTLENFALPLQTLVQAHSVTFLSAGHPVPSGCVSLEVRPDCYLHLALQDVIDPAKELGRLDVRKGKLLNELEKLEKSTKVQEKEMNKKDKLEAEVKQIASYIPVLKTLSRS